MNKNNIVPRNVVRGVSHNVNIKFCYPRGVRHATADYKDLFSENSLRLIVNKKCTIQ